MKSLLITDDDEGQRDMLREVLRKAGYQTDEACSGQEAIEKALSKDFDVFLLDVIMPGINGIDVVPELKRLRPGAKTIVMTGFPTVESAVDAVRKGASDYISKPYRAKELLLAIRQVIEETRFEETIEKLGFDKALVSLSNPLRRRIIMLLSSGNSMRLNEITRELGIDDHTKVVFHTRMLKDSGFVEQGETKTYFLTSQGIKTVECLNILKYYFQN